MASITKLYLRDAAWTSSGSLGEEGSFAGTMPTTSLFGSPDVTATGASTNRQLKPTAGTAQQSVSVSIAGTAAQSAWFRRFISDPLSAQTIGSQTLTYAGAAAESNAASDFIPSVGVWLWRPSTGAIVDTLVPVGDLRVTEPGTSQTAGTATATTKATTAADGDVLVVELFRAVGGQVNTASRTNTVYYDGTTEGSTTSNAAYVAFATAVAIQSRTNTALTASISPSATLGTAYTPAPTVTPGLTAVFTHTE